jgi:serine phosphatase RsbU (regulator of sigma subunit)
MDPAEASEAPRATEVLVARRPRAILVGSGIPQAIVRAVESQADVALQGLDTLDATSADLLVVHIGLPEAGLREVLRRLGPPGGDGRPAVLLAIHLDRRAPSSLLEMVDEILSDVMEDAELQVRLRAVLRGRQALAELHRKNAELERLYGRVESLAGRMAEELRLASHVQRSLLPPPFAHPRLQVAREYIPVREIGGDYFDLIPLSAHRFAFALGDVMGKGVPAALLAANLKACLRAQLQGTDVRPAELISRVNRLFWEVTPKGLFASLLFGIFDLNGRFFTYVNAGHEHPFVVREDGRTDDLVTGGTVLGLLEAAPFDQGRIDVGRHDLFVFFSDGITDRTAADGQFFGRDRLRTAALRSRKDPARLALYSLLGDVQGFAAGRPADHDLTLIVAKLR